MEAVSAIAAVIQVAQFSSKLSISLQSFVDADVRTIAKDISLSGAAIQNLRRALEHGNRMGMCLPDAYEDSFRTVDEIMNVLHKIEALLEKATGGIGGVEKAPSTKMEKLKRKFMWPFRKRRVEELRRNLESLKTTVILQAEVLILAERTKQSAGHAGEEAEEIAEKAKTAEEIYSLASLVMANQAAIRDFRAIHEAAVGEGSASQKVALNGIYGREQKEQSSSQNDTGSLDLRGVLDLNAMAADPGGINREATALGVQSATAQGPVINNRGGPSESTELPQGLAGGSSLPYEQTSGPEGDKYPINLQDKEDWHTLDLLDLALCKLNLFKWEHDRHRKALSRRGGKAPSNKTVNASRKRLANRLKNYQVEESSIKALMQRMDRRHAGSFHGRQSVEWAVDREEFGEEELEGFGLRYRKAGDAGSLVVTRRIQPLLDDALWSVLAERRSLVPSKRHRKFQKPAHGQERYGGEPVDNLERQGSGDEASDDEMVTKSGSARAWEPLVAYSHATTSGVEPGELSEPDSGLSEEDVMAQTRGSVGRPSVVSCANTVVGPAVEEFPQRNIGLDDAMAIVDGLLRRWVL